MQGKLNYSEEEIDLTSIKWSEERAGSKLEPQEYLVLKQSIEQLGLLHPIIVAKCEDGYHGVSGYHRWKAMLEKGITRAKVRIIPCDQKNMILVEIIENYGRGRGDDWGLLKRLAELTEKHKIPLEEISRITGYSVSTLSKMMRVYKKSPPKILELIKQGKLGIWHALELLRLKDEITMLEYAELAAKYRWSVRELRETINRYLEARQAYYQELATTIHDTQEETPPEPQTETPIPEPSYPAQTQETPQENQEPEQEQEPPKPIEPDITTPKPPWTPPQIIREQPTNQQETPKCFFCNRPIKGIPIQIYADKQCLITAAVALKKIAELLDKPIHKLKPTDITILDQITQYALAYLEQQEQHQKQTKTTNQNNQ